MACRNILSPLTWKLLFSTRRLLPFPDHLNAHPEDYGDDDDDDPEDWDRIASVHGLLTLGDKQRLLPRLPASAADDSAADAALVFHFNSNGNGSGNGNGDMAAMATPAFAPPPLVSSEGAEFANLFAELPNLLQGLCLFQ